MGDSNRGQLVLHVAVVLVAENLRLDRQRGRFCRDVRRRRRSRRNVFRRIDVRDVLVQFRLPGNVVLVDAGLVSDESPGSVLHIVAASDQPEVVAAPLDTRHFRFVSLQPGMDKMRSEVWQLAKARAPREKS